jgi:hypothetical protein
MKSISASTRHHKHPIAIDTSSGTLAPDLVFVQRTPYGYVCAGLGKEASRLLRAAFDDRGSYFLKSDIAKAQRRGFTIPLAELDDANLRRLALAAALTKEYNPDEPRDDHGRWTTGGASGGSTEDAPARGGSSRSHAEAPSSAAASGMEAAAGVAAEGTVLGPLSAEALAGLASIAAGIAGAAAAFGLVFIPSPNAGVTSQGAVPGEPGLDYSLDHDDGSLRITRTGPAGDEVLAAAHLGQDGVYRDENGVPVARAVGGSVIIDPDAARAAIAAQDAQDDEDADQMAGAMAEPDAKTEEPKLCPEPVLDTPHGASDRARAYEELIHNLVNPENPLPQGFGVSLLNPISGNIVFFDDCIQTSGIMVDAKGPGYADLLSQEFQQREDVGASVKLLEQATRQTEAAGARPIIWFFAEESAADYVRKLFERDVRLNQIEVVFYPPMGGN